MDPGRNAWDRAVIPSMASGPPREGAARFACAPSDTGSPVRVLPALRVQLAEGALHAQLNLKLRVRIVVELEQPGRRARRAVGLLRERREIPVVERRPRVDHSAAERHASAQLRVRRARDEMVRDPVVQVLRTQGHGLDQLLVAPPSRVLSVLSPPFCATAIEVPPTATTSAIRLRTRPGDRCFLILLIIFLPLSGIDRHEPLTCPSCERKPAPSALVAADGQLGPS